MTVVAETASSMRCFFFQFHFCCADLNNSRRQQVSLDVLEAFRIPVAVSLVNFAFDLCNTSFDVGTVAGTFDDGGFVFGDNHLSGLSVGRYSCFLI